MKKVLTTTVLWAAFLSTPAWASCYQCCTNPSDIVYCISSEDGKNCTGGCDCCPSASQIGQNPDGTFFCCKGDTPQVTDVQGKEGYKICCQDGQSAYLTTSGASVCCAGTVTFGPPSTVTSATTQADYSWHCCEHGSWVLEREDGETNEKRYVCGGDAYCQAVYGAGTWMMTSGGERTDQNQYGCGGSDYCQARYGAGTWGITLGCSNGSRGLGWIFYGCGGDDYCMKTETSDYRWGCYSAEKPVCDYSSDCGSTVIDNGCYRRDDYVPSE